MYSSSSKIAYIKKQDSYYSAQYREYKPKKRIKTKKKANFIALIFAFIFLACYGYFICPYGYKHFVEPLLVNRILNSKIKNLDIKPYFYPTVAYLNNSYLFDEPILTPRTKSTILTDIVSTGELTSTKQKLLNLFNNYPNLSPSVFVWEYTTGKSIEINADEIYPSASIIKIPIAAELIRKISDSENTKEPIKLSDKRLYSDEFKTLGSGKLQYTQSNVLYSLDYLANIMISESDNSATNMLLYEIGGMDGFNRAMRNLGLKITSMGDWLPDMDGNNKITAREISTILYNINNPNYINPKYKNRLKEYLGNTKNIHLLKEKLPQGTTILHKTGNIGSMLGDSGVIYTNNGKKYIVTILVKRPKNDLRAKTLIQDASELIYKDIDSL